MFDGVFFVDGTTGAPDFRPLPPPTDEEVGAVLARIAARVQRLLRRRGFDSGDDEGGHPALLTAVVARHRRCGNGPGGS